MPTNYQGNDTFDTNVVIPNDGEAANALSLNGMAQPLANRTQHAKQRLDPIATLAALSALDVTSASAYPEGTVRHVLDHGLYTLKRADAGAVFSPFKVSATGVANARWVASTPREQTITRIVGAASWPGHILGTSISHATSGVHVGCDTDTGQAQFFPASTAMFDMRDTAEVCVLQVNAGAQSSFGLFFPADALVIHGATLSSVVMRYRGAVGHGALPAQLPRFGVGRTTISDGADVSLLSGASGLVVDGSGTVGAYEAFHDVTFTANQNNVIDRTLYSYGITFWTESGANALALSRIAAFTFNFTAVPDARRR